MKISDQRKNIKFHTILTYFLENIAGFSPCCLWWFRWARRVECSCCCCCCCYSNCSLVPDQREFSRVSSTCAHCPPTTIDLASRVPNGIALKERQTMSIKFQWIKFSLSPLTLGRRDLVFLSSFFLACGFVAESTSSMWSRSGECEGWQFL